MLDAILRKIGNGKCEICLAYWKQGTIICKNLQFQPIAMNGLDFRAI